MKNWLKRPLVLFVICLAIMPGLSFFGPEERSLGSNVRLVYLHGAWVLTAEMAFALSGVFGLLHLGLRFFKRGGDRSALISKTLGLAGIIYWISYLPLSLLAMQANWNGLFLAEPRFALALTFAVVGALLQAGLWMIDNTTLTAASNAAFIIALRVVFANAANIMHPPPSPIFNSGNYIIIGYFVGLMGLTFISGFLLFLAIYERQPRSY